MEEENRDPSSNQDAKSASGGKNQQNGASGGLLDELRSVLSSLGKELPKEPEPPKKNKKDFSFERDVAEPLSEEKIDDFDASKAGLDPAANSDADFWNGNVLGWPSSPDDVLNSPALNESENILRFDEPSAPPPPPPPPAVTPAPPPAAPVSSFDELLSSAPVAPTNANPTGQPAAPASPAPPFEKFNVGRLVQDDSLPDLNPQPIIEVTLTPSQPPPAPPPFPIPGTMEKKSAPPPPEEKGLDLTGGEIKPKGLVQIACVYPEGFEKEGKQFVDKLREAGEKSRKPLIVQSVFLQAWPTGKLDALAWKKAATMSGADVLFVVASKSDQQAVKKSLDDSRKDGGPIRERMVFIEQVGLRALYADVLIELERNANGHG